MGSLKKKSWKIKFSKKKIWISAFLILVFFLFIKFFIPKSYQKEYLVDGVTVLEEYNKKLGSYFFTFYDDGFQYVTTFQKKYEIKRKHVLGVEVYHEQDETCLKINSDTINFFPLCKKKEEQIAYHLVSDSMANFLGSDSFPSPVSVSLKNDKLEVFSTLSHTYYIYNYKGFYKVQDTGIEFIPLFSKDVYDVPLITQVNDFLVIPDYEQSFYFQKIYLLNIKTGEVIPWEIKESIYFDSMILGVYENSLYLIDKHEKVEWKLDVKKRKLEKVSHGEIGKTFHNIWEEKSMNRIMLDNDIFQFSKNITYDISNGIWAKILEKKILISTLIPKKMIEHGDEVFYLVNDSFYVYSNSYGEVLLMKAFEWNFNYQNMIFVS